MEGKTQERSSLDVLVSLCDGGKRSYMDALAQALRENIGEYDEIKKLSDNELCHYLAVRKGSQWGVVDRSGKEIYNVMFDEVKYDEDSDVIWVKEGNKWGVLDIEGKCVQEPMFDEIREFYNNKYAAVRIGDKWGFINKKGEQICEAEYEEVGDFEFEWYVPIKLNGKWGLATKQPRKGQENTFFLICDCVYDNVININDRYLACEQNGKWGILDGKNRILPCEYDNITFLKGHDRGLILKKGEEEYKIDRKNIKQSFKEYYGIKI